MSTTPARPPQPLRALAAFCTALIVAACGGGGAATPGAEPTPPPAAVAGVSIAVGPAAATAFADSGRMLTVTLLRSGGFVGDVDVALANPPAGVSAEPVVFSSSLASLELQVRLDGTVAPGTLVLEFKAAGAAGSNVTANAQVQLAVQAPQPAAQQLIADALTAGRIDSDTALLYRLYALFGDPRLPVEFVGSGSAQEDLRLFWEVEAALPQMSAAAQAALRPFMLRPDHPESIYRPPAVAGRSRALSARRERALATPPAASCVAGELWRSVRSAAIPVRVWSECYADDNRSRWGMQRADVTLAQIEQMWPRMTSLMGAPRLDSGDADNGGDDAIDVYLVGSYSLSREAQPINTADLGRSLGYARSANPCPRNGAGNLSCSGYLVLPARTAGDQRQRATVTHELFHILQFRRNTSLMQVAGWFTDASATWAESHYDRVLDWPRKVALDEVHQPRFKAFMSVDDSVNSSAGLRPYESYIWPFFLEQETGSADIIGQIWRALESAKTAADADRLIDAQYSFNAHFHRFAVRNVNESLTPGDPLPVAKRYVNLAGAGQFPDGEVLPRYVQGTLSAGNVYTHRYGIEPWSAEYARFVVNGQAVPNRVEVDFSELAQGGALKVDALILTRTATGDKWVEQPVVLNPDELAVFCFDLGKSTPTVRGEFKELRLVLSNAARDIRIGGNLIVRPTSKPCGVWEGTTETTIEYEFGGLKTRMTGRAEVAFDFDETESSAGLRVFTVRSGNFTYHMRSDQPQRNPPCRAEGTASGTIRPQNAPADLSDGASAGSVRTFFGDNGQPQYAGGGLITFTTVTVVDNCNDRNVDVTSTAPMSSVVLWAPQEGAVFDIKDNGRTMQENRSFVVGPETRSSTWLLTKKNE